MKYIYIYIYIYIYKYFSILLTKITVLHITKSICQNTKYCSKPIIQNQKKQKVNKKHKKIYQKILYDIF